MSFLIRLAALAFAFGVYILLAWHGTLDVRVALAGLYFLIGVTAASGASILIWLTQHWTRRDGS